MPQRSREDEQKNSGRRSGCSEKERGTGKETDLAKSSDFVDNGSDLEEVKLIWKRLRWEKLTRSKCD